MKIQTTVTLFKESLFEGHVGQASMLQSLRTTKKQKSSRSQEHKKDSLK